uniref:MFS domain-containing protein n=1 Tax=Steinernema glaseri TaxID=37863 RepID=A0A1I7YU12_9BILA
MDSSDCLTILGNDGAESKIGIRERLGGVYGILLFAAGNGSLEMELVELVPPATISVLWQMPQFTVMALGECVVGHTALQFAYSQASASMKSAITCIYLFTALLGNVINVGILSIKMAESSLSHMIKSLIYTILLFLDFAVFVWVASGYIYVDVQETPEEVELLGGEETTGSPSVNQA